MKPTLDHLTAVCSRRALGSGSAGLHQTIERLTKVLPASTPVETGLPDAFARAKQAARHTRDLLIFMKMMSTALDEVSKLLDRAWTLSQQAQAVTASDLDRLSQDSAFQSILASLRHLLETAAFHGVPLHGPLEISFGEEANLLKIEVEALQLGLSGDVKTPANAHTVTKGVDAARKRIALRRQALSHFAQQLSDLASFQGIRAQTLASSKGCMQDLQVADEVLGLTRLNVLGRETRSGRTRP